MKQLIRPGCVLYAMGIAALGFLGIVYKDFIIGRPPAWPERFNIDPIILYLATGLLIASSIAIIIDRKMVWGAVCIAALIFLLSILRFVPDFMGNWLAGYKTGALFGGSLIMISSGSSITEGVRNKLIIIGSVCLALFFLASGYAHFMFAGFVETFIPEYIPFRKFWTYFTAICLIAGGLGILIPVTRKWAALLSALMLAGWCLFLHIPRFIMNSTDASDRMGLCESFTLAGIFFVLSGVSDKKISPVKEGQF